MGLRLKERNSLKGKKCKGKTEGSHGEECRKVGEEKELVKQKNAGTSLRGTIGGRGI